MKNHMLPVAIKDIKAGNFFPANACLGLLLGMLGFFPEINAQCPDSAPIIGTITQPDCFVATGRVVLNNLPASSWTVSGTNGTTFSGDGPTGTTPDLAPGTYTFFVAYADGVACSTPFYSDPVVIDAPPASPSAPVAVIDCSLGFGLAIVNVTSPTGSGIEYSLDAGPYQGETSFNNVNNGPHTITARNSSGCTSTGNSFDVACGCADSPIITLSSTSGSTCSLTPITVSGNTFGGSATRVTITSNGVSSVSPGIASTTPFSFTYTPGRRDEGKNITITVSTNNPRGAPCEAATETYSLTVNPNSSVPTIGTITNPTCTLATGSVVLNNLPSQGNWTLRRNPGGVETTGTTASTVVSDLLPGTYTFAVASDNNCWSDPSANVIIAPSPAQPTAPAVNSVIHPTCQVATGSVMLTGLPAAGTWILTRYPGGIMSPGTTINHTVSGLVPGTYSFTVMNSDGCTSSASSDIVINAQPLPPPAPSAGPIIQPTCSSASGSVVLSGLPEGNWIINPGTITGSGNNTTINGLDHGTYNFTVTNAAGCISAPSYNVVINPQPQAPAAPVAGPVTQPTCAVSTGSVVLSGLPSGNWIINPGAIAGSGFSTTISALVTGSYYFSVTNSQGCNSPTTNVVINPPPLSSPAPVVGSITQPTCDIETGSVILSGLPAGSWVINPGAITGSGPNTAVTGLATGTYNFTNTNSAGCTSAASADVIINDKPHKPDPPKIGNITQPGCDSPTGSVELTGLPHGNWIINPGAITGNTSRRIISGLLPGTYAFTVTNEADCTSLPSAEVVIFPQPPTPSVSDMTTSVPSDITFTVTPAGVPEGTTYTWTTPEYTGGVSGGSAQPVPQTSISGTLKIPSGTGTARYTVTPTTGICSGNTFRLTVYVTSVCEPASIQTQPSDQTMCSTSGEASLTVIAAGTSPFAYQWQYNAGGSWTNVSDGTPAGAAYSGQNTSTLNLTGITAAGNFQYRCHITNCSGGNSINSNAANLSVNATPAQPSIGTITQPTCRIATGSVILNGLPIGNWTLNPGSISGMGPSITIDGLVAGTYSYTVTNARGCISPASTGIVILAPPQTPATPTVGTITQPTCAVATGSVVLSGLPAGNWILNPGSITGSSASWTISGLVAGTHTFNVTNAAGCISAGISVTINPLSGCAPLAVNDVNETHINTPVTGNVAINDTPGAAGGNSWTLVGVNGGATHGSISMNSDGVYTYTPENNFTGTDVFTYRLCDVHAECSTATVTITVTTAEVNQPPVARNDFDTTYTGTAVSVHILKNDLDPENAKLTVTLCSNPLQGTAMIIDNTNITYIPLQGFSGDDSLCYRICDPGTPILCDEAMIYIHVIPPTNPDYLKIYNALTPNGDGSNDSWKIGGIENFPENEIKVFNRWGELIYQGNHYDNINVFWNGRFKDKVLPDGTYYYSIAIKGFKTHTGWIYLRDGK